MASELLHGDPSDHQLTEQVISPTWRAGGRAWQLAFVITGAGTLGLVALITYTVATGIGLWGNQNSSAWGFAIINFVWWIGIGHAGTFISAVLLLFEQRWRTSINRFAEAMTLFAVVQAAMFPLLHLGRPWFGYWLFPYPSTTAVWPQTRSALPWDAAAITTYGLVSLLFWYLGMLPDLAALRDHSPTRRRRIVYGILAMGWRGKASAWRHYQAGYLLLAGLATPLVISVHSIVSSDFAIGLTPGWHTTIFPPYFVAGAIFSGFAMVLTLVIPARAILGMKNLITQKHLENCAKLTLVTGLIVSYGYIVEYWGAWYSASPFEIDQYFDARPTGANWGVFAAQMICNVLVPQLFWFRRIRTSVWALFVISILINIGMWAERFVIVTSSLSHEFLPSMWHAFKPTWVDLGILAGTMCFFAFLFLLFMRFLPFVSLSEVKELRHELAAEPIGGSGESRHA